MGVDILHPNKHIQILLIGNKRVIVILSNLDLKLGRINELMGYCNAHTILETMRYGCPL